MKIWFLVLFFPNLTQIVQLATFEIHQTQHEIHFQEAMTLYEGMKQETDPRFLTFIAQVQQICKDQSKARQEMAAAQLAAQVVGQKVGLIVLGSLAALWLAPVLAPLVAATGLHGAAAYTSGLATLGGGSIASGGAGMAGGLTTLALGGGSLGSLFSQTLESSTLTQNEAQEEEERQVFTTCIEQEIHQVGTSIGFKKIHFHPTNYSITYYADLSLSEQIRYRGEFKDGLPLRGRLLWKSGNELHLLFVVP